jgi:hypothetical protein
MHSSGHVTVYRSDLPTWLNWPSGKLLIGDSRVALLVGGKHRRLRVPLGTQHIKVVIYSFLPGSHDIMLTVAVEEGKDYRYRCHSIPGVSLRAHTQQAGLSVVMVCAMALGWLTVPALREQAIELQLRAVSAMPMLGSAIIPLLYRAALALTSELSGTVIGGIVFLWVTRGIRLNLWSRCLFCLEKDGIAAAAR